MKYAILLFLICTSTVFAYSKLRTGTYLVSGDNTKWGGKAYQGEVTIEPQGENYKLIWRIGSGQVQMGVGILYDDILNVAFADSRNGSWGVCMYRVLPGYELEGRWTYSEGTSQKPEYLIWKGY